MRPVLRQPNQTKENKTKEEQIQLSSHPFLSEGYTRRTIYTEETDTFSNEFLLWGFESSFIIKDLTSLASHSLLPSESW